jgi:hypothetical protein
MIRSASREKGTHMQFDRAKLRAAILYVCNNCEASQLGAVKLHKVLYFADMLHYAWNGVPITGATYRKRPLGPTCDQLLTTLASLARDGSIEIREIDYFGYRKKEFISLKPCDVILFNNNELAILNEVIEFVCRNNTAKTISDFSHNKAWDLAKFGDILKYNSVFHLFPTQVSAESMEWATQEISKIEDQKSPGRAVASVSFGDFRKRVLEDLRTK